MIAVDIAKRDEVWASFRKSGLKRGFIVSFSKAAFDAVNNGEVAYELPEGAVIDTWEDKATDTVYVKIWKDDAPIVLEGSRYPMKQRVELANGILFIHESKYMPLAG